MSCDHTFAFQLPVGYLYCPKCGSYLTQQEDGSLLATNYDEASIMRTACCNLQPEFTVPVSIRMPLDMFHKVHKQGLRRAGVAIEAVDWSKTMFTCPGCNKSWPPMTLPELTDDRT